MSNNNPKPENLVFRSQICPKKRLFGLMDIVIGRISTKCYPHMRVIISSCHCVCITSIVSKNYPKPGRIWSSRVRNIQKKKLLA